MVGDPRVGKTSTILRFTDQAFRGTYIPTMGVNLSEKQIQFEDDSIEFILWDIAGQSKFQTTRKHFYRGAHGLLLVFDLTRPETFKSVGKWQLDIRRHLDMEIPGLIMANKNDLVDQRRVSIEEISKLADELGLEYFETSALTGENIDGAFYRLGDLILKKQKSA